MKAFYGRVLVSLICLCILGGKTSAANPVFIAAPLLGQQAIGAGEGGFGLKIYKVESGLYPFVQVYFRTFDTNMRPLTNLNQANIGLMVQGRSYDPMKGQYRIQTLRNRREAVRTVVVLDASKTMDGLPFSEAVKATRRFIESKRQNDQVAILAMRGPSGYEMVSGFERDAGALGRRLTDVRCDGGETRLYDTIGAAMQMCGLVSQGGLSTSDAEYIISNSILVLSDGKDEGSALTREELMSRITSLSIPIPIYSIAYSGINVDPASYRNLEALSKNSFGIFYTVGDGLSRLQQCVEDMQQILQNDYVLTFRSYLMPPDGNTYNFHVGLEYPSGTAKMTYQRGTFEAVQPPQLGQISAAVDEFNKLIPALADGNPYLK